SKGLQVQLVAAKGIRQQEPKQPGLVQRRNDVGRQGTGGLNPIRRGAKQLHQAVRAVDRICCLDRLCDWPRRPTSARTHIFSMLMSQQSRRHARNRRAGSWWTVARRDPPLLASIIPSPAVEV